MSDGATAATTSPARLWPGLLLAAAAAVLFSGKAIVAKLIYRHGTDALELLALRLLLALPFFVLAAWWTGRSAPPLSWAERRQLLLLGFLGYYLASLLDFEGLRHVSVGLERLILFLGPAIVLVLGQLCFGRPTTRRQWLAMALAYAGVALVFVHDLEHARGNVLLGAALVGGAALSYSLYLLLAADLVRKLGSLRLVSHAMLASTVLTLAHYLLLRPAAVLLAQPPAVYGLSLVNAACCTIVPVWCTMRAVAAIGPGPVAQAGMLGPVSLLPLGWLLLGEPVTPIQVGGTVLVLAGIGLLARGPAPAR